MCRFIERSQTIAQIASSESKIAIKRLLRMTFPPGQTGEEKFTALMSNMMREQNMAVTERADANSPKARRTEFMQRLRDEFEPGKVPNTLFELMHSQLRNEGLQVR